MSPLAPIARRALTAALFASLLLAGCTTAPDNGDDTDTGNGDDDLGNGDPGTTNATFETIEHGSYGEGPSQAEQRIIGDQDAWAEFWQEHANRTTDENASATPPEVDFDEWFVLYAYAGQKTTGGHQINVTNVSMENGSYNVTLLERSPGVTCITTQVLTYPYHIVRIERAGDTGAGTAPEATFDRQSETYDC